MGRSYFVETRKLFQVFGFLVGKVPSVVLKRDREGRLLFTDLYCHYILKGAKIPSFPVAEVFPGILDLEIRIFGASDPHLTGSYDERAMLVSPFELKVLSGITKLYSRSRVLEIGTFRGGSTYQFYLNSPRKAEIFTLDFNPRYDFPEPIGRAFASGRIHRLHGNSTTMDFEPYYGTFDIVFIDGGHDWKTVESDTRNGIKLLRKGGVLIWHDYRPLFPDVFRYLNELSEKLPLQRIDHTSLVVYKP